MTLPKPHEAFRASFLLIFDIFRDIQRGLFVFFVYLLTSSLFFFWSCCRCFRPGPRFQPPRFRRRFPRVSAVATRLQSRGWRCTQSKAYSGLCQKLWKLHDVKHDLFPSFTFILSERARPRSVAPAAEGARRQAVAARRGPRVGISNCARENRSPIGRRR